MPKTSDIINQPTTKSAQSMFIKQKGPVLTKSNPLEEDDQSIGDGSSDTGTHSQYRPNYPVNFDPHVLEDNFFKSLESKF